VSGIQIVMPSSIPPTISTIVDQAPAAPSIRETGIWKGSGNPRQGVWQSIGDSPTAVAPPSPAAPPKPIRISQFGEGNLAYKVQPQYPQIARVAGVQGAVRLRAIVSRTGTIENLSVISGHAMLVAAAVEAVKHWRYRPYMLNGEPIEVETEITVNFTLAGH
jgi:protein TonB